MKRIISVLIFFILLNYTSFAQKKVIPNNPDYEFQSEKQQKQENTTQNTTATYKPRNTTTYQPQWSFGGNLGASFWNGGGNVIIAPKAYYHFSPTFFTGLGLTYMYSKGTNYNTYESQSVNSFGGSVMLGARLVRFLQLSATYEGLSSNYSYGETYWNNALYLGASFITGNVAFGFQYDVLYNSNTSPYSSAWGPVISFYF